MPHPALLLLAAALAPAAASRLHITEAAGREGLWAGRTLRERYRLEELLPGAPPWESARLTGSFPYGRGQSSPLSRERYASPSKLGSGKAGEAWLATDTVEKRKVVLKLFYVADEPPYYVTKEAMAADGEVRRLVEKGEEECALVQRITGEESLHPKGRDRVCRCLASHLRDQVRKDDVAFLVLEDCGESVRSKLEQEWRQPAAVASFRAEARQWVRGALMGVAFLAGLPTPILHMDIHWDNVVISAAGARLIDFGMAQPFNRSFPDLSYPRAPPEHPWTKGGAGCCGMPWSKPTKIKTYPRDKAWAYDVWSVGSLYYELLCGQENFPFKTSLAMERFAASQAVAECGDGSLGLGEAADWKVVAAALAPYEKRRSPTELLQQLP